MERAEKLQKSQALQRLAERLGLGSQLVVAAEQPALQTGLQNANVVLECADRKLLLRCFPPPAADDDSGGGATPMLHNNELWVLQLLEGAKPGLAPRCLLHDFDGDLAAELGGAVLVEEFVENCGALAPTELTDDVLRQVAPLLAAVHSVPVPPQQREAHAPLCDDALLLPEPHAQQAFLHADPALRPRLEALWQLLVAKSSPHLPRFAALPRRSLLHGDAHCGNILKSRPGLRLVDWEAAHLGCVLEDIACFLAVAFPRLTQDREALFLKAYSAAAAAAGAAAPTTVLFDDEAALWPMLRLFKVRKLVRMIAFFNKALAALPAASPAATTLGAGLSFFVASLEAELKLLGELPPTLQ